MSTDITITGRGLRDNNTLNHPGGSCLRFPDKYTRLGVEPLGKHVEKSIVQRDIAIGRPIIFRLKLQAKDEKTIAHK